MDLRNSISTQLPKAVIASTIISLFNMYTEGMNSLVRFGTEFFFYTLAIFLGFVVFSAIWEGESDDREG